MDSAELRRAFTSFFEERGHTLVPSAGLIPLHPSAPMFTNSGMMPFVPYFLGEEPVPYQPPRATSVQRCVRAGGKHNDLDAIGRSRRHLSFFEMLGNFSFNDYFKPDAIAWAWEFVTEVLGLDADRMWITVHVSDDEAEEIWADSVGVPRERIQRLDKDNFWEMGDTGPCGPSSEIFWDYGPDLGPEGGPANPASEERYVEVWNLVFPQYFRGTDGELSDLGSRNIDTGAGFERLLAVLAGSPSLYVADTVSRLVDAAQEVTGRRLGDSEQGDVALRLIADHARTMTFLITDGVIPSNEERGYVLRRIIRRAIRFAYLLGVEQAITPRMAQHTVDVMGEAYPEVVASAEQVQVVLEREEAQFRRTLRSGLSILDTELDQLDAGGTVAGAVAFQLHDTYGFPLEVTTEIASDRGYQVDTAAFDAAMAEQRRRARESGKKGGVAADDQTTGYAAILAEHGTTTFTGRDENESKATVLAVVPGAEGRESEIGIILDRTPFYAESGGQVGDTGTITTPTGTVEVLDTTYVRPGLHLHRAKPVEGTIEVGQEATAAIDVARRDAIRRNHTGTHVLHWALREVLGDHVKQQGSLVAPDRMRFDFSHFEPVTAEQIQAIEDLANGEILDNAPVRHYETTKAEAAALGAIAFFGEKYGEIVRVLEAGRHSTELCGGTHVKALGDIGPMKVVSEGSIGSNLRRIEAVTGTGPIERLRREEAQLERAAGLVGVPPAELLDGISKRLDEAKALRDEVKALRRQLAGSEAEALVGAAVEGVVVAEVQGATRDELRDLGLALRDRPGIRGVVLGSRPEAGGVALVAAVAPDSGLHAGDLIADAAKTIGGGGGKAPDIAVAGGRDPSGLPAALDQARAARLVSRRPEVRVLALDLGTRRIGVAVSDATETLASPRPPLERSGDRDRDHRRLAEIVAEEEAGLVLVGLPLSLDGTDGPAAEAARQEMDELRAVLGVPVEAHDERLTTVTAHRLLAEQGLDSRKRRSVVDGAAAAVLLQSWLDGRRADIRDAGRS